MKVEIGKRKLIDITVFDLFELIIIEGVVSGLEYWNKPYMTDFTKTMFSDTIVIDYNQTRKSDGMLNDTLIFYFNHEKLSFHWRRESQNNSRPDQSSRLRIESIKFLIQKGYDVPIY